MNSEVGWHNIMRASKKSPTGFECANCGQNGDSLPSCTRCRLVHYCDRACQRQHWKAFHKTQCLAPEQRRPGVAEAVAVKECAICKLAMEEVSELTLCCQHTFHAACLETMVKYQNSNCAICRAPFNFMDSVFDTHYNLVKASLETGRFSERTRVSLKIIQDNADKGHSQSQFAMGVFFCSTDSGSAKGIAYLRMAAAGNHSEAQALLGRKLKYGEGVPVDHAEAFRYSLRAAKAGVVGAQVSVGVHFHEGDGVAQDFSLALFWYRKAIEKNDPRAMFNTARMMVCGECSEIDEGKAFQLCEAAANSGKVKDSMDLLGYLYQKGYGVEKNLEKAFFWWTKGAEAGVTASMVNAGKALHNGDGVDKDLDKAHHWYKEAALRGDKDGMNLLGHCYVHGIGVEISYPTAQMWFSMSGSDDSLLMLGKLFFNGEVIFDETTVEEKLTKSIQLFKESAAMGNVEANLYLGELYLDGIGVERSMEYSIQYFAKAAELGDETAKRNLALLLECMNEAKLFF